MQQRAHLLEDLADARADEQAGVDSREERLEDGGADELVRWVVVVQVGEKWRQQEGP